MPSRKDKAREVAGMLRRVKLDGKYQIMAIHTAILEAEADDANLPYIHNMLARAWGLPEIRANHAR